MRRNSTSFTATEKLRAKNKSRRTEFSFRSDEPDEPRDPNATLFESLMNDPVKRTMVMQLINSEKEAIEEYKRQERLKQMKVVYQSPADKVRRKYVLESPTALLRRRELEMQERSDSGSSCSERSVTPLPKPVVPFDRVLENVVAFVEVRSRDEDRSDGVKALLRSMGATVVDNFTREVTHVIFKDGSFLTYQKAKLMKKHLVSVLWLETIRTTGCRVPERSYPALGTSSCDNNVTLICEKLQNEYMDVVKEEMRKTVTYNDALSQKTLSSQQNKIALLSQLSNLRNSTPATSFSDDLIPISQDVEVRSFTSRSSKLLRRQKTPDSLVLAESDAESDCGVVNGYSYRKSQSNKFNKHRTVSSDDSEQLCYSSGSSKPSEPDKTIMPELDLNDLINNSIKVTDINNKNSTRKRKVGISTPSSDLLASNNKNLNSKFEVSVIPATPSKEDDGKIEGDSAESSSIASKDSDEELNPKPKTTENKKKRRTLYSINNHKELLNITDEEDRKTSRKTRSSMYNSVETHTKDEYEKDTIKQNARRSLYNQPKTQIDKKNKRRTAHPLQTVQKTDASSGSKTTGTTLDNQENGSAETVVWPSTESIGTRKKDSLESVITNVSANSSGITKLEDSKCISSVKNKTGITLQSRESGSAETVVWPSSESSGSKEKELLDLATTNVSASSSSKKNAEDSTRNSSVKNKTGTTLHNQENGSTESIVCSSLESNGSKRKESIESVNTNVSEELGAYVTRRKPRKVRVSLDKDGFKIPDKSNSSILTNDAAATGDSSTERVQESRLSTSTEGQLSSLRISEASAKKSITSVEMSPLILSKTDSSSQTDLSRKSSFSPLDKINNSNSISNLIAHLDSSNTSNELLNVSTKAVRGRRKTKQRKEDANKSPVVKVKGDNILGESKKVNVLKRHRISDDEDSSPVKKLSSSDDKSSPGKENLITTRKSTRGLRKTTYPDESNKKFEEAEKIIGGDEDSSPVKKLSSSDDNSSAGKENLITTRKSTRRLRKTTYPDESNKKNEESEKIVSSSDDNSVSGKQNLVTTRKNVRVLGKTTSPNESAKKRGRKLYNPNNSYTEALQLELIEQVEKDELSRKNELAKIDELGKKTTIVPETPILLTARTKKLIESKLCSNSSDTDDEEMVRNILKSIEKTPKIKRNKKKEVHVDSRLDEQKDLIKEFVERKGRALTLRSQRVRDDSLPIKPQLNRRSTMDFMPKGTPTPKKTMKGKLKRPSIVCTRFHRKDVQIFQQIVKKLGHFIVENEVTDRTTHLIVAEPSRTINILRAIARGIWVLRSEWLYSSLENSKWLPEEDYELINFSPSVQQCRIERQAFGSRYSMDVFSNCGPIYVARSTNPRCSDLEELITLGKGTTVNTGRSATICVGEVLRYEHITCVDVKWVLDCVTFNVCKNFDDYVLQVSKPRRSENF